MQIIEIMYNKSNNRNNNNILTLLYALVLPEKMFLLYNVRVKPDVERNQKSCS